MRILLVDDEEGIREQLSTFLRARGYDPVPAASAEQALDLLASHACRMALVDYKMPGADGLTLVRRIRELYPDVVMIMMTAYGTVDSAVEALRAGVHDYLLKPLRPEHLEAKLALVAQKLRADDELLGLRRLMDERLRFDQLIGATPAMQEVFALLEVAAGRDLPVLIVGETGTGKELAAKAIHANSARRAKPFVALNCGAIPESLVESELFGHVRGAFTGAATTRDGKLAMAHEGTLFLDELSSAPEGFQVRLLRFLEDRTFSPVGADATRVVNTRVIAAMNVMPEDAVARGDLRRDLFYRLNVLRIELPPLRDRLEDVPLLFRHIAARWAGEEGGEPRAASPEFISELCSRAWPGNVRELQNFVVACLACSRGPLTLDSVPRHLRRRPAGPMDVEKLPDTVALNDYLDACERAHIERVLGHTQGNMRRAAELLGVTERGLRRKVVRLGIDRHALVSAAGAPEDAPLSAADASDTDTDTDVGRDADA